MPTRYFLNNLPDAPAHGAPLQIPNQQVLEALKATLNYVLAGKQRPFVYTGAAGVAYMCWHVHRRVAELGETIREEDLVEAGLQLSRNALKDAEAYPLQQHGWALLGGHAGVYCTAALCLNKAANFEERRGKLHLAAGLREELADCLHKYGEAGGLALSRACQEDEFLYGRAGYVFGGLMLNKHIRTDAVSSELLHQVVDMMLESGRGVARTTGHQISHYRGCPLLYFWPPGPDASSYLGAAHGLMGRQQAREADSAHMPYYWHWHEKPYLGAAHGAIGILYTVLHFPGLLAPGSAVRREVEAALAYVLSLECDAQGVRGPGALSAGQHGHYPTQMGPWRDREPLVHWCHGATGAVFLFCKAYQVIGQRSYLEAAGRSGEAVWGHGLLKKGPGACHGVSGSAYALLCLYRATQNPMWAHRASQFAQFMLSDEFERGARTPDHPRSLFEGWAAACCLWADLLQPQSAGFPFFELDI